MDRFLPRFKFIFLLFLIEYMAINVPINCDKVIAKLVEFNLKNGDRHWISNENFETLRLLVEHGVKISNEVR